MKTRSYSRRAILGILGAVFATSSKALAASRPFMLITPDEAALPAYKGAKPVGAELKLRGAAAGGQALGPRLIVISPVAAGGRLILHRPVSIHIRFETSDGSRVDLTTLKVTYLRLFGVDTTERLRPYLNANGLDIDNADIPEGDHSILVEVGDTLGRKSKLTLNLAIE
jgi:hypothetical protein